MKKILIGAALIVFIFLFLIAIKPSRDDSPTSQTETELNLQDAHGLAVDRKNPSRVYIATHTGLLALKDDTELVRVSDARDDYMGFSAHPKDANVFYSSGHPSSGGNIGFQKSSDGGKTWTKVSDGVGGPVDFHALTVSQADPGIVYGTYKGQLQRSTNEGKDWDVVQTAPDGIYALATNTEDSGNLYAGTADGLKSSNDKGATWSGLNLSGTVATVTVNPINSNEIVAYVVDAGLMRTTDSGKSWKQLNAYKGDLVMQIAYDPQNADTMYLINQSLEIYKTKDGATTWSKVR